MRSGIRCSVFGIPWLALLGLGLVPSTEGGQTGRDCLLVRGALGDAQFDPAFAAMESGWRRAAELAGDMRFVAVKTKPEFREALEKVTRGDGEELWIVLVGHGTDDGRAAKFNLEGEDVSAAELGSWLSGWTKALMVINNASASGPFIPALSGKNRVVVTATQSGNEVYAPRFGLHLARVLCAPEADLDRDGAVSLLEGVVVAANRVAAEYRADNRLATEHALVDDNGDRKGTPADWFEGLQLKKKPRDEGAADGRLARRAAFVRAPADRSLSGEQRQARDALERQLEALKEKRGTMEEADFFRRAEEILRKLGPLNGVRPGQGSHDR